VPKLFRPPRLPSILGGRPPAPGEDARAIARTLLDAVLRRRSALDEALAVHAGLSLLTPRDRAFARLLVATVLRRLGQIDALIDSCIDRPMPDRAAPARDAIRIGAAQLLFLGTPPHAAVSRAVASLAGRDAAYRGLVNAVLRRISREGAARIVGQDAARINTPDWLWQSWSSAFGEATCRRIAEQHLAEPPLDLTVKSDPEIWATKLDAVVMPTGSLRRDAGGAVTELPGFEEGEWWVQDAAAVLPARILLSALGGGADVRIADLCAAPGGKAAQLALAGARVSAFDISTARLRQLRVNLSRLGLDAECTNADARAFAPAEPYPGVLLDAPCASTGTIRRHPDVLRLKSPDDVARLAHLQRQMLDAAARALATGGVLVYAVCSLEPDEGPRQIEDLLARLPGLARLPVRPDELGPDAAALAPLVTPAGDVQTLPCHFAERGGLDGFYVARLVRRD
jgi:16S rRNA (cytosine967-C5)-methyltransferase